MTKLTVEQLLAGVSAGLLLGFIMGLSFSPVVGTFIGLLAPIAIAWMTFRVDNKKDEGSNDNASQSVHAKKIAFFCSAALVGIIVGIFIRTHNTLGISFKDEIDTKVSAWNGAGLTKEAALNLVALEYINKAPKKEGSRSFTTGLFNFSHSPESNLKHLDPSRYSNTNELLEAYKAHEGPAAAIASVMQSLNEDQRKELADSIWNIVKNNHQ